MTIISAEKIIKKYGNSAILKDIDFNVNSGEFIGIMGKSGSGKSTLLKILGLMEYKSAGKLYFKENNIEELSEEQLSKIRRDEFGFVFQEFFLMDSLNVLENVLLPILIGRTNAINEEKKALQLMDTFGILHLKNKMPMEISGGERQRVAICRALINDPSVIFADEPTGNLDSKSGQIVIDILNDINIKHKKTIIMVTHDPAVASYCKKLLFLKDGMIMGEMTRDGSRERFYEEIVKQMKTM